MDNTLSKKIAFLESTKPFDLLPFPELEELAGMMQEIKFENTETLYFQHKTDLTGLDIITKGQYEAFFYNSSGGKECVKKVTSPQTYGAFSILINKGKSIYNVEVSRNTVVYRIPKKYFKELCKKYDDFYGVFLDGFGKEMLQDKFAANVTRHESEVNPFTFDRYFVKQLNTVELRPLVTCESQAPCHEVARLMEKSKVSCIFLLDGDQMIGYVTDIILRNKIVAEQKPSSTPAAEVMEKGIYKVDKNAYVYETIMSMFAHKMRYIVVEDNGRPAGMLSRNKLLTDHSQSPFVFIQSVRLAQSTDELREKWAQAPAMVHGLLSRGIKSELVNQVITSVSDTIALKVIDQVISEMGQPPAKFAFMVLGSEGRMEQTLKTDQDNAIIYEDKANEFRELTRTYFLEFASRISQYLNDIGFAFCTGGLMAKNPKWTHSLSHWKRNYDEWIGQPDAQAVMNFSTFFDCRLLYGEQSLIDGLQQHILEKLESANDYFYVQLANNALKYEPPLGFFRNIKTFAKDDQKVFNIKHAMTPIVDLVRVYALKHKVMATNTGERLMALKDQKVFTQVDFHELMQSYYYLMGMRLKYQALQIIQDDTEPHNYVNPSTLTKIEEVTVIEIFKVIGIFQDRIKMIFKRGMK